MQDILVKTGGIVASSIGCMNIHARIKQRREDLKLSMRDLAQRVGVRAWQTVQQWEMEDGTAPSRKRLEVVARALETTPEYLVSGVEGGSPPDAGKPDTMSWPFQTVSREKYQSLPQRDKRMIELIVRMYVDQATLEDEQGSALGGVAERLYELIRQQGASNGDRTSGVG